MPGLRRLRAEEIAELEPHCAGIAGLHSPNTGIVDFGAVARAMADDVRGAGGELALGRAVHRASRATTARSRLEGAEIAARHAVFCAGGAGQPPGRGGRARRRTRASSPSAGST